jgi:hypothetical protein
MRAREGGVCDGLCGDVDPTGRVVPIPSEDANLGRGMGEAGEERRDCGRRRGMGLGLGLDAALYTKET